METVDVPSHVGAVGGGTGGKSDAVNGTGEYRQEFESGILDRSPQPGCQETGKSKGKRAGFMRTEKFKMERPGLVKAGDKVKINELKTGAYAYIIEPAVAMSGFYQERERIKSEYGIVNEVQENDRGFYDVSYTHLLAIRIKMEEILNRYPGYPCRIRLFENGRQLLADTESFDIVFLDVDMPGLDGIQTAGKLRERDKKVKILYLSAYQDFAPSAFSVHAFAYLVKPAREEDLWRQLDEAIEYMHLEEPKTVLDFQTTEGRIRFAAEDILYFEYIDRKAHV